jgi:hypothetical protein
MIAMAGYFNRAQLDNQTKAKKNNFKLNAEANLEL